MSVREPDQPPCLVYGRRRGHALRPGRARLMATMLPHLRIALPGDGGIDPRHLFTAPIAAVWLELGFGGGEHLAAQAATHADIGMLGAEVFENGVARLLSEIAARGLRNIRIFPDDGRALIAALSERSIGRAFILFPDPWPKERHKKRRLVAPATLDALARVMEDGAELRLATDDMDYARAMLAHATRHPSFRWLAASARDWRERAPDGAPTRYEMKALAAGRRPLYLRFERIARGS